MDVEASFDPVASAQTAETAAKILFQRFDLVTRRLSRSIVARQTERHQDATFAESLRSALGQGDHDPVFLFASNEAIMGEASEGPGGFPNHLVFKLRDHLDIPGEVSNDSSTATGPGGDGAASGPDPMAAPGLPSWNQDVDFAQYAQRVHRVRSSVEQGDLEGAVLSLELSRTTKVDPFDVYRRFVTTNPSPFGYVFRLGRHALVGSSPLAFLSIENRRARVETDAGTRPVTGDASVDDAAEADLLTNAKDAAEHRVVVDAETDALRSIARSGHVERVVDREVRRFSHVMHLYTVLEADLADDLGISEAILALSPVAAVSGRPKRAAAQLGRELEGSPRGPYGGIIGMIEPRTGRVDLAVVIRSLWFSDRVARLRVGGKIVAESDAEAEYRECLAKSRFIVEAVAFAERLAR